jgi:hypothetical protein
MYHLLVAHQEVETLNKHVQNRSTTEQSQEGMAIL